MSEFFVLKHKVNFPADTEFMSSRDANNRGPGMECSKCGGAISPLRWLPPYRGELETWGSAFGDIAFGSLGLARFVVSERFADLFQREGLVGLSEFIPVTVVKHIKHRRISGEPPNYFLAMPMFSPTTIDVVASGFEYDPVEICSECQTGRFLLRRKSIVITDGTWSGEDAFFARGDYANVLCSERFKEFCVRNEIKNAPLLPASEYGIDWYPGRTGKVS